MEAAVLSALNASEEAIRILGVEHVFGPGGQNHTMLVDFTNTDAGDGKVETAIAFYEDGELVIDLASAEEEPDDADYEYYGDDFDDYDDQPFA